MSRNLRASGSPRRASRRFLRTLLPMVGLFSGACTFDHTIVPDAPAPLLPGQVQIYQNHNLLPAITEFCDNLLWLTCEHPEVTDDQAFMGANKQTYGPPAFIAPAEDLNSHQSDVDFQAGAVLVGYVYVAPDGQGAPLPSTYTDLKLNYGHNCLYLRHESGAFKAYVVPQNATCGAYTPVPAHQLNVQAVSSASFPGHPNIPPVARFHEGNKGPLQGVPLLGMKCGDKWCLVLPQGPGVSEWTPPHDGVHNEWKTWVVYGWNDSQHLAVRKQGGGGLDRSNMRVSAVADTGLGNITEAMFAQGYQHVATVFFRGNPSDKYADTWHYGRGHNEIFLRKNANQSWQAEIRHTRYILGMPVIINVTTAPVERRDHNAPVPATARFLWTIDDEDLWIACDDGCCRVIS